MNRKFYRIWFIIGFLVSAGEVFPLFAIYTYDRSGSRTGVVFPDESVTALGKPSVRYCYDQANRLTKVIRTGAADQATTYEYYPDGLLQKINYANGVTSSLTYQDNGWVKSIDTVRHKAGQSDELISRYEYKYDGDGNRIEMQETNATPARRRVDSNWASAEVTTYAYDPQGRLIQVNYPDGRQANYSYDAVGNRMTETETKTGAMIKDRTFAYNPLNQLMYIRDNLTLARSVGYTYDGRGETTAKIIGGIDSDGNVVSETQRLEFAWDPAGHLRKVTKKVPGSNDEVIAEFTYDYAGRRVRKESRFSFLSGGPSPLESRLYAYDQTSALAEYGLDPTGHPLKDRQYVYAHELLSAEHLLSGQPQASFYHQDALGSTVNLTQSTGELEESYLYDAWGNFRKVDVNGQYSPSPDVDPNGYFDWLTYLANSQGAFSEDWNRCTYTGHEYDPETGLYFFKARFYDPDLGRFVSEDPYLGDNTIPPSLHRYLYAYDSPLRYVDLTGYFSMAWQEKENGRRAAYVESGDFDINAGREAFEKNVLSLYKESWNWSSEKKRSLLANFWVMNHGKIEVGSLIYLPESEGFPFSEASLKAIKRDAGSSTSPEEYRLKLIARGVDLHDRVMLRCIAKSYLNVIKEYINSFNSFTGAYGIAMDVNEKARLAKILSTAEGRALFMKNLSDYLDSEDGQADIAGKVVFGVMLGKVISMTAIDPELAQLKLERPAMPKALNPNPPSINETAATPETSAAPNRGVDWVTETPTTRNPLVWDYQSSATGARSNIATRQPAVPALRYDNPNSKGQNMVRFDGMEDNVLIDRKWNITSKTKQLDDLRRMSEALRQNPGYRGRIEVPTEAIANRTRSILRSLRIENIEVKVVPPQ